MRMRTLRAHISNVHDGEKSFVCEYCAKSFAERKDLKDHRVVHHSSERTFKCHICEKAYFLKNHLNDHFKKGHPTSLDYECEHCGKKFATSYVFNRHRQDVHEKVPCEKCGKLKSPRDFKDQRHKCKELKLKKASSKKL